MWEMFHPEEKYPYPSLSNQAVMLKVPQGYTMEIPKVGTSSQLPEFKVTS